MKIRIIVPYLSYKEGDIVEVQDDHIAVMLSRIGLHEILKEDDKNDR